VVGLAEAHRRRHPLQQELRPELHHVPILDRPRLALVGVDDHDPRPGLGTDGLPFAEGREARAAHAGQAGGLEPLQDLVGRQFRRLPDLVLLLQPQVGAVRHPADDLVALHADGRQVAVADAGDR
jgi:hypothetical protein